jgi:hypothetical protein
VKIASATLKSVSPYSQSRKYNTPKKEKESPADYEERTWRDHCHVNSDGFIVIPPMAFKNCLAEAAKYLSIKIPGRGKATYTKNFEAGVLVTDPLVLPIKKEEVEGEWLFLPSDGKRGSGSRVDKSYPLIREWGGDVRFFVLDDTITQDTFKYHLEQAGKFIGIGRFRPRNNGYYGRFTVENIAWSEE